MSACGHSARGCCHGMMSAVDQNDAHVCVCYNNMSACATTETRHLDRVGQLSEFELRSVRLLACVL